MMAPFAITFYRFPALIKDLNSYMEKYDSKQVKKIAFSFEGQVVNALFELRLDGQYYISSKDVLNKMKELGYEVDKVTDSKVGKTRAEKLHIDADFLTAPAGDGKGKTKKCIMWDDELMKDLMNRYIVPEQRKKYKILFKKSDKEQKPEEKKAGSEKKKSELDEDETWYV